MNPAVLRRSRRDVGSGIRIRTGSIAERGWCTSLNPPPDCVSVPGRRLRVGVGEGRERRLRSCEHGDMSCEVVVDVAGVHNAHPFGLVAALAHPRKSMRTTRVLATRPRIIAAPLSVHATVGVFKGITFTFVLVKVFLCSFKVPNSSRIGTDVHFRRHFCRSGPSVLNLVFP